MLPLATLVDTEALWKIAVAGLGAGVGLVVIYGLLVLALEKLEDARGGGPDGVGASSGAAVAGYGLAAIVLAAAVVAIVVLGVIAMAHKS